MSRATDLSAFSECSNDWLSPTAGRLDTYSAGSVGTCTPFSCSAGQSERPVRPRKHELGCNFRETTQKMVIACFTNGQNIAMTIPKQHSDETVGLPTRASSKICPAFSGRPNDWLSPTDRFLNAHGIGQCGARPHSLVKRLRLTDSRLCERSASARVFL